MLIAYKKSMKYLILFITASFTIYAQSPPSDFKLVGTTSGAPWTASETITILANGGVNFFRHSGVESLETLLDTSFTINSSQVQQIWQAIQDNNYFSLNSNYKDSTRHDGSFVLFTITANGNTKQVSVKNIQLPEIQTIVTSINNNVPSEYNLNYAVPEKINVIPTDPCGNSLGFSQSLLKEFSNKTFTDETEVKNNPAASLNEIQIPHGGVEIGYQMSLFNAVVSGRASLKSKGEYFGDGVSITGDNTKNFPPNDNTIHIKLNLEFYGPCDNAANEQKIINDILNKWDGQTTSGGKEIKMEVAALSHPGASSPPGTPGFNNIRLECDPVRSFVDPLGMPNSNEVSGGTWYTSDRPGVYAHEAGHLMGLDDQYEDWNKQPDNSWTSSGDGTNLSNTDFMNLYNSKYGTNHPPSKFDKVQNLAIPYDGHENDLMGNRSGTPLQSDIDKLAALAGLIININEGNIFTDSHVFRQSLVVIHRGDLFLNPGEKKTLDGIYTACIDNAKIPPSEDAVLDIAPSLDKWNGVPSAEYLLKLVRHIDSIQYYCGDWGDAQLAVWRITDNSSGGSKMVDSLLKYAGLDIGNQILYFPRLINNSPVDTISQVIIPKELFVPDIQPKSVQGEIGQNLTFNASVAKPEGFNYSTDFIWSLEPPLGSSTQISSNGSFTPDKKGFYTVSVNIDITDTLNATSGYTSDKKAFAVIPNKFTETFEHTNLNGRLQWETYGDSKWEITDEDAHSGFHSVKPVDVSGGKSSVLAIDVNLPSDTSIAFGVKALINTSALLTFEVDSIVIDTWQKSIDWQIFEYNLSAGEHRLTWTYKNNNIVNPSIVWLDNIFFPSNSVVLEINEQEQVPSAFNLFQNYPNPFNPTTEIKYSLAERSFVKMVLFDVLGRKIKDLFIGEQSTGLHQIMFDASNLSSGIYFYTIEANYGNSVFKNVKKMILLK